AHFAGIPAMLIHFRCRRCRNAVSVAARQADCPLICPVCKCEIVVPSASEIPPPVPTVASRPVASATAVRPAAALAFASPVPAVPPLSPPVAPAPVSLKPKRSRVALHPVAFVAASIGVLVLVAAGWTTNRVWSKWRQPAAQEVALLEE